MERNSGANKFANVLGWERKVKEAEAGGRPMYRPREWMAEERSRKKILKKISWYKPS